MEFLDFKETLQMLGEAQNWRPLGDGLSRALYEAVVGKTGIGAEAYLTLFGNLLAEPRQTPAHLLAAIKAVRVQQLREQEQAASPGFKSFGDMSADERASYLATIQRVKAGLAADLARLDAEGRLPQASSAGSGLTPIAFCLSGAVAKLGIQDQALSKALESTQAEAEVSDEVWIDA